MLRAPARTYLVVTLLALAATASGQWVEDSIDVGGAWVGDLVYNSREDVVYGASEDGPVFAIDCSSNQVIASFNALGPNDVAYCSTGNKAYCTAADTLLVIDGASHTLLKAMYLEWATDCVWDPVNNCVYVSCGDNNEVAVVDCTSDSVTDRIGVGRWPIRMFLSIRHHKLYVLNDDSESISIVDLESHEVVATIRLDNVPTAGCYSNAADKFYCGATDRLVVVDGVGDSVVASIEMPLPSWVSGLQAVDGQGLVMCATYNSNQGYVRVFDAHADTLTAILPVGRNPTALCWSQVSNLVYCGNSTSDNLTVLKGDGSSVVKSIPVGDYPFVQLACPSHRRVYVGHLGTHRVYVVRDSVTGIGEFGRVLPRPMPSIAVHPNPFTRHVVLRCADITGGGEIAVYAGSGRKVRRILPEASTGGDCIAVWNGTDETGRAVPPGVYCIVAGEDRQNRARVVKLE